MTSHPGLPGYGEEEERVEEESPAIVRQLRNESFLNAPPLFKHAEPLFLLPGSKQKESAKKNKNANYERPLKAARSVKKRESL